jgi:endonuclease/exonuclease/phosphatase family metal-dependent hydrolase
VYVGGVRVLTWNLKHGRAVPSAGCDLFDDFAAALARWEWGVALLQEVPPWWPQPLAQRLGAQQRLVLTSRNWLLAARRAVAVRWPDAIKSNGGSCNAILARGGLEIADHRTRRLGLLPERRWVHAVRLRDGIWVGNTHTEARPEQGLAAAAAVLDWSAEDPAIFGGDFNVARLALPGFEPGCRHGVDQVFVRGLEVQGCEVLDRGRLSDHAPVVGEVGRRAGVGLSRRERTS